MRLADYRILGLVSQNFLSYVVKGLLILKQLDAWLRTPHYI